MRNHWCGKAIVYWFDGLQCGNLDVSLMMYIRSYGLCNEGENLREIRKMIASMSLSVNTEILLMLKSKNC